MPAGKIVSFDEIRGYGFVAPENGGEDVFVHVNSLTFDKRLLGPGVAVKFDVMESERGLKASRVDLVESPQSGTADAARKKAEAHNQDDGMCDVLTVKEFLDEVTESLISAAPSVTGEQITLIRRQLVHMAHKHGWVEA
ncbi:DNA-binding protein [Amycolatopsis sp. WAC 04197]|uniref:cold-shock protein n=1 Tax=Amycolatopsis sp. WAC 04197 TaxID=2203199 RepID=UPI000F799D28|nr:cold shock domain-containing protein [Amycolatopsis sp. WAC 04197]RSN39707.1 DNA-binding protein [Amycolatopsis sp. WAC 04197]